MLQYLAKLDGLGMLSGGDPGGLMPPPASGSGGASGAPALVAAYTPPRRPN